VGVLLAAAPSLLPNAILLSMSEAPNVRIRVIDGAADTLLPALAAGEIDVVIGRISPFAQRRGLQHEVLYDEPIVVCARPRHPIFRPSKRKVTLGEIARYPWILPPTGVSLRREIDNALERANVTAPDDLVESVSILTNRALVMKGDVLAFLPANVVAEDVRLGLIKTLPPPFDIAVDPVGLTFRDDGDLSAHALAFIACVRRAARR
jgi:DNA-binding transcriptional LysR family regulator